VEYWFWMVLDGLGISLQHWWALLATLHSLDWHSHTNLKIVENMCWRAARCRNFSPTLHSGADPLKNHKKSMLITIGSASLLSLQLSNLSQLCQSQAQPVAKKTSVLHYNDYPWVHSNMSTVTILNTCILRLAIRAPPRTPESWTAHW
jgi:hypothetical protein